MPEASVWLRGVIAPAMLAAGLTALPQGASAQNVFCGVVTPCATTPIAIGDGLTIRQNPPRPGQAEYITTTTRAAAVSANGAFVALSMPAYSWQASPTSFRSLSPFPATNGGQLLPNDIGNDGTVVGSSDVDVHFGTAVAWVARPNVAPAALPHIAGLTVTQSGATGITPDGAVIVGWAGSGAQLVGERWVLTNGAYVPSSIGTVGGAQVQPQDVNATGSVIVGQLDYGSNNTSAFRWTQGGGVTDIGKLPGAVFTDALGVSGDGATVVGYSNLARGSLAYFPRNAFRWTAQTGMVNLGVVAGDLASAQVQANAASLDGSVIVGQSTVGLGISNPVAFRWTEDTGMRDLNSLLSGAGVNMSNIVLQNATDVSADGTIIVGDGSFLFPAYSLTSAFYVRYDDGVAGMTTPQSVTASVQRLAESRANLGVQQNQMAGLLLGRGAPMQDGRYAAAFAAVGSFAAGAYGQAGVGPVTLLGGVGTTSTEPGGAELNDAALVALALRAQASFLVLKPFIELGGWATTEGDYGFTRVYANGAGFATGQGVTSGDMVYGFGRIGVEAFATPLDQLVLSAELGRQQTNIEGYAETATASNPFPATIEGGHQASDQARLQAQWSHVLTSRLRLTGSLEHVWESTPEVDGLRTGVIGLGVLPAAAIGASKYWFYSLRGAYQFAPRIGGEVFVQGVAGDSRTEAGAHAGVALRIDL